MLEIFPCIEETKERKQNKNINDFRNKAEIR